MGILEKIKKTKSEEAAEAKKDAVVSDTKKETVSDADSAKKNEKKTTPASVQPMQTGHSDAFDVIIRPLLSEKTSRLEAEGQYSFEINRNANKVQVKNAVEAIYGVRPVSVNVVHTDGKRVRFGKYRGRRNDQKKAIVTLPKGKKIDIHEGV